MMRFTIGGKAYEVNKEQILKVMEGKEPEPLRKYSVEIEGRKYPIKQVIEVVLGINRIAFTSMDAYRILTKLGFKVQRH